MAAESTNPSKTAKKDEGSVKDADKIKKDSEEEQKKAADEKKPLTVPQGEFSGERDKTTLSFLDFLKTTWAIV